MDRLQKEISAVMVAFEVQLEETTHISGHTRIPAGHVVWDVKMNFTCNAWYVAGRHRRNPPKLLIYLSVVSRELVQIAMMIAALNGLNIQMTNIGNAYLIMAPITEKCYVIAGGEFGPDLRPLLDQG
jgi:hypothetical protein